ncbi:Gfo/Idh/MocA family oxidoreductase [Paenibacillus lycopersici]|uniref:Gfo/Idh/MocA family oxidoreductase n=1 Tax=Paenibacillus lycopersici TaxID=2704462 RepID=A0A6C0FSF3_9BACL|nr:Gfo/Idh/MocA family oxidoreductase [Paenibacillus lycopersici]QHT59787.1 Gfo/Idh/MocA family oxidoreductase [Paenibacillus lycopersici]
MNKVRVGVIGVGGIANACHLPNYMKNPHAELVAVADRDLARAEEIAAKYGNVQAFDSAEAMFSRTKLDAVSICTFNESHVRLALLALERGLDVLVEKPMAVSPEEAELLRAKANESDRIVMVGMSARYSNPFAALHAIAASGELGEIYYAKARFMRRRGVPYGWFTSNQYSGGGPMMDIGVHALDAAWWMMGMPEPERALGKLFHKIAPYDTKGVGFYEAMSSENKADPVYDVEDLGTAFITFKNGAALTIDASWAVNGIQDDTIKIELYGTKGGASLDPFTVFKELNRLPVDSALKVAVNDNYESEINHFIDCVRERKQPLSGADQGYQIVRMLDAIRRSSEAGDSVII